MNTDIVAVQHHGEARVNTRDLAARMGNKHANVLALVRDYQDDFAGFGQVTFETETVRNSVGAANQTTFVLLNENQCYFLLTLVRNSEQTVPMKAELVRAFDTARATLAPIPAPSPLALSRAMLEALEQQDARVTALEHRMDSAPIQGERIGTLHKLCQELGQAMGDYRRAYRLLYDRFNLASYRDCPNNRYEDAVRFVRVQIAAYTGTPLLEVTA